MTATTNKTEPITKEETRKIKLGLPLSHANYKLSQAEIETVESGFPIWRDIEGYEGLYQVSTHGGVKQLETIVTTKDGKYMRTNKECIKKENYNGRGYSQTCLTKDNTTKMYNIHRLVAEAFIHNFYDYDTVDHIEPIKVDNSIHNLQWLSRADNIRKEHSGELNHNTKLTNESALFVYTLAWNGISHKEIVATVKEKFGVDITKQTLSDIKHGRSFASITRHNDKLPQ